jgi:hypothetical protein
VAAAYDQSNRRQRDRRVCEQDGVNVSFDVMDGNERDLAGEAEGFSVCDTDKQRSNKSRAGRDRDGGEIAERNARLLESLADHRHNGAQVFTRGELGNDPAIFCVNVELRGDDARANLAALLDNGGGGFIARTLDP